MVDASTRQAGRTSERGDGLPHQSCGVSQPLGSFNDLELRVIRASPRAWLRTIDALRGHPLRFAQQGRQWLTSR